MTLRDLGKTFCLFMRIYPHRSQTGSFLDQLQNNNVKPYPTRAGGTSDRAEHQGCQPGHATEHLMMTGGLNTTRLVPLGLQTHVSFSLSLSLPCSYTFSRLGFEILCILDMFLLDIEHHSASLHM